MVSNNKNSLLANTLENKETIKNGNRKGGIKEKPKAVSGTETGTATNAKSTGSAADGFGIKKLSDSIYIYKRKVVAYRVFLLYRVTGYCKNS